MKKYKTVEKYIESEEADQIICNLCGKIILIDKDLDKGIDCFSSEYSFGYGSKFDDRHIVFDLHDECLTKLIKDFKIDPWEY